MTKPTTPLRAEGRLIFKGGSFPIAECVDNETAAVIVGIVNGQEKIREALQVAELALTDGRIRTTNMDHPAFYSTLERAAEIVKAALAAGGEKV